MEIHERNRSANIPQRTKNESRSQWLAGVTGRRRIIFQAFLDFVSLKFSTRRKWSSGKKENERGERAREKDSILLACVQECERSILRLVCEGREREREGELLRNPIYSFVGSCTLQESFLRNIRGWFWWLKRERACRKEDFPVYISRSGIQLLTSRRNNARGESNNRLNANNRTF